MNMSKLIKNAAWGRKNERIPFTIYDSFIPEKVDQKVLHEKGIGIIKKSMDFKIEYPDVEININRYKESGKIIEETIWKTPWGDLNQLSRYEGNYGSFFTYKFLVEKIKDVNILCNVMENCIVKANFDDYYKLNKDLGNKGVVFSYTERTPFQLLLNIYAGPINLSFLLFDFPDEVEKLIKILQQREERMIEILIDSPAELIWIPDTITAPLIGRDNFKKYNCISYLKYHDELSGSGKKIMVHMDGVLSSISDIIAKSPVNIIEGFTPPPMGDLSISEARNLWLDKSLWLNFTPSVFLQEWDIIKNYTVELINENKDRPGFLIGITENFPLEHWEKTSSAIISAINEAHDIF
ncbi:MAG: uroporphyrinogen decarboxylase family protein [Actinomycetota bacterium]|nr:uroporphyrinogen decarboxylase family protein [Actinomycetota bacterium]